MNLASSTTAKAITSTPSPLCKKPSQKIPATAKPLSSPDSRSTSPASPRNPYSISKKFSPGIPAPVSTPLTSSAWPTSKPRTTPAPASPSPKCFPSRQTPLRPTFSPHACCSASISAKATRRSEEHTSELQSRQYLVCRLLLEKKKQTPPVHTHTCD